jgi:hypothetical protein
MMQLWADHLDGLRAEALPRIVQQEDWPMPRR